ncbi:MAG: class I SAM-dependent methyltransferase, partial [Chloroflexales bacterium]|nr:class I SAM-dependent methyltransferase [Chloroflexales bacterium]
MLKKVSGPDQAGREAMYYADRQDFAYQHGAYSYLESVAMLPRLATLGAYVKAFGLTSVLDVGCGTAGLLPFLDPEVAYIGVDISPTAIDAARARFQDRAGASFYVADFRRWECPLNAVDGVVWAGIGCAWTRKGRGGSAQDWLDILALAERPLHPEGRLLFELVSNHWPALERVIQGRYSYETGCDIDCIQSEESARRAIRVFKKKADRVERPPGSGLIAAQTAHQILRHARGMGQLTDEPSGNLGFGYLYYSLTRIYQPQTIVCIGSYRGFSPVCFTLGLGDNGSGM